MKPEARLSSKSENMTTIPIEVDVSTEQLLQASERALAQDAGESLDAKSLICASISRASFHGWDTKQCRSLNALLSNEVSVTSSTVASW
jgi:hypothetical protein